jgi:site-specific DNA recombinase
LEGLQARLDVLYEDRLDGRIDAAMYDRNAKQIREQQIRIQQRIRSAEATTLPPMIRAADLIVRTSQSAQRFSEEPAAEQRHFLQLVLTAASWKSGELRMSLREPFEKLRLSNPASNTNHNGLAAKSSNFDNWRRKRDSNPRVSYPTNGFQDRRLRPLGHSSAPYYIGDAVPGRVSASRSSCS